MPYFNGHIIIIEGFSGKAMLFFFLLNP